jgi:hypothetical protein
MKPSKVAEMFIEAENLLLTPVDIFPMSLSHLCVHLKFCTNIDCFAILNTASVMGISDELLFAYFYP